MVTRVLSACILLSWLTTAAVADPKLGLEEFRTGRVRTFSTNGHHKAGGINLTIDYPQSWIAVEGIRPHIVQNLRSQGGESMENVAILFGGMSPPAGKVLTTDDKAALISPDGMKDFFLPDGATLIEARSTKIETIPAGILEYRLQAERAGVSLLTQSQVLMFFVGDTFISITFQVFAPAGAEGLLESRMLAAKPLYLLMMNSIVLPDMWNATLSPSADPPPPTEVMPTPAAMEPPFSMKRGEPVLSFFEAFVITWGVGLIPPLTIRYVLFRRPLRRRPATWIAASFSVFFWFLFLAVIEAMNAHRVGVGSCWVLVFFAARGILVRQSASTPDAASA